MKKCNKCSAELPFSLFSKDKSNKDGLKRHCKVCVSKWDKARFQRLTPEQKIKRREYNRKWMRENFDKETSRVRFKKYREENRQKVRAGQKLRYHVKVGNIAKLPCQICGSVLSEAHHQDYNKPLDVMWLCHLHHMQVEHGIVEL